MVVCTSIVSNAQQFGLWREALLYLMMNEMMLEIRSMANCSNEIERIRHIARFVDAMLEMTEDRQFTVEVPGVSAFRASDIGIAIAIGWHVGSRNSMPLPCSVEDLMRSSPGADGGESKSSVTKAMFHSQDSGAAIKTWRSQILLLLSLASKNQKEFASRVRSAQEKEARRSSMRGADIGSPDAKRRRGASASASVAAASASAAPASAGDCGSVVRTACANMVSLDMATNADILVHRMCKNCESLSDVEAVFRRIGADGEESRARLATRMEQALRASGESRMSIFSSKDAAAAREAAAMPPLRAGEIGTGVRVKLVALAPVTAWALVALGKRPALVKGRFAAFHTDLEAARLQDILVFPRVVFEPGPAATA
jgi:hypothetical protein